LFFSAHCSAAVLEVGLDKPYQVIWYALRDARPGDTVLVYPGIYTGAALFVGEGITLAAAGPGTTVILYNPKASQGNILSCAENAVVRGFWLLGAPVSVVNPFRQPAFRLENCVIWGNKGVIAPYYPGWHAVITNCTIFGNEEGIVCEEGCTSSLRNTIVWGNTSNLVGSVDDISVSYCDIEGGWPGEGNIDAEPMFVQDTPFDPYAMPWPPTLEAIKADLRPAAGSPCVDAGSNKPSQFLTTDIAGNPRVMFGGKTLTADIGAYERWAAGLLPGPGEMDMSLTWSSLPDKSYSIFWSDDLLTWHVAEAALPGSETEVTTRWIDDGSLTGVPPSLVPRRFYRILDNP
jgi:hypothetical protein